MSKTIGKIIMKLNIIKYLGIPTYIMKGICRMNYARYYYSEQGEDILLEQYIEIKLYPINTILEKYLPAGQRISFLNIDVEGFEMRILKTFDFEKYYPDFLLIENFETRDKDFMEFQETELYQLMKSNGYGVLSKTIYTILFKKM